MKYPTNLPVKIVQLGAGGTGGHVAPHLYRLLYSLERPARLILCDGDIVEPRNLVRQNFSPADLGENKAKVLAERYASVFGIKTEYVPSYVEDLEELMTLITPGEWELDPNSYRRMPEMVILLGCVDNNRSRQLCHQAFYKARDLIYIDSGNGDFSGQVVCGVRRKSFTVFKPVGGVHPQMLKEKGNFPSEMSCAVAAQSDPQSMAANITAATAVVDMVYNILTHGESRVRQTDFSTKTVKMQTILENPRRIGA